MIEQNHSKERSNDVHVCTGSQLSLFLALYLYSGLTVTFSRISIAGLPETTCDIIITTLACERRRPQAKVTPFLCRPSTFHSVMHDVDSNSVGSALSDALRQ